MVDELHAAGFKVTLWVTPFFDASSEMYAEGAPKGYFCGGADGLPGFFKWWNNPEACALDVTNPEATAWFVGKLKALQVRDHLQR
jgi:alpha-glucosidase (family GH31 glycosyl hydrolase)